MAKSTRSVRLPQTWTTNQQASLNRLGSWLMVLISSVVDTGPDHLGMWLTALITSGCPPKEWAVMFTHHPDGTLSPCKGRELVVGVETGVVRGVQFGTPAAGADPLTTVPCSRVWTTRSRARLADAAAGAARRPAVGHGLQLQSLWIIPAAAVS